MDFFSFEENFRARVNGWTRVRNRAAIVLVPDETVTFLRTCRTCRIVNVIPRIIETQRRGDRRLDTKRSRDLSSVPLFPSARVSPFKFYSNDHAPTFYGKRNAVAGNRIAAHLIPRA